MKPKFSIDQVVFVIDHDWVDNPSLHEIPVLKQMKICQIQLEPIQYGFYGCLGAWASEEDIFDDYNQAQKEYERRQK